MKNIWISLSLKQKLKAFTIIVISVMCVSVLLNFQLMKVFSDSFEEILDDNSRCYDFQEALNQESKTFNAYVRRRTEESRAEYERARDRAAECVLALPFDYERIGRERFARTWNVVNGYENYSSARDQILQSKEVNKEYVTKLYQVYDMQSYLQIYASRLVEATLKEENRSYQEKEGLFHSIPYLILICSVGMTAIAVYLSRTIGNLVIHPLEKLVAASREIERNDFSGNDLVAENPDEMGEMVRAFNRMKHATAGYINTLKKNNEMASRLHREELEKIEMEKRLDAARLEILKSQINPHFLFNTLNMIACMAKLEGAATTEKMITSLSNLFRYNLKTSEQIVPLEQELRVVRDYMYIQQMRFGGRIQFECQVKADAKQIRIPAFTLQPLVENAIIHGLSKKEQGGRLLLKVWQKDELVIVSVADTGLGMAEEERKKLEAALEGKRTAKVGIGLGNIYHRIHSIYQDGQLRIFSKAGSGTVIQMWIPQRKVSAAETASENEKETLAEEGTGDVPDVDCR
ncbi:MAG: sensor histidine kinase [Lachnospiraceae bacterium]|nr:sensor histidine kinase [Lachnospiraceae bacterium]